MKIRKAVFPVAGFVETVRLNGQRCDCGLIDGNMQAVHHEYQKRLVV